MSLKRAIFSSDSIAGYLFPGYSDGNTWNGWACPYFERNTAVAVLEAAGANGFSSEYDVEKDAFIVHNVSDDLDSAPEQFRGLDIEIEGRSIHVYPIGAYSWIWDRRDI